MAQRAFRLSVSPEDVPEVRRVLDFDGRATLAQVHDEIAAAFELDASDHLYAFFLSGRFWDAKSAYLDPRTDGERADKALLFRLGLTAGKSFAYLLDFGSEQRFVVTVVEVREAAQPLGEPVLVESVGDVSTVPTPDGPQLDPPEIAELVPLAEAYLDADDRLEDFAEELGKARDAAYRWELEDEAPDEPSMGEAPPVELDHVAPVVRGAAAEAMRLAHALAGSVARFLALDEWLLEHSLGTRLLDLPLTVALVGDFDLALALARALVFADRELMEGDVAVILARAGRRQEALAQLDANLSQAEDAALVELKAGDTHRTLGDLAAAEAYYRRSFEVATSPVARQDARLRLAGCLMDAGRSAEAQLLFRVAEETVNSALAQAALPEVGRNDPCPCGSGKKYKKCHGAS